jgi:hypothetical protein
MNFLESIRSLPEKKRKIIFWCLTAAVGSIMIFFWAKNTFGDVKNFDRQELINGINFHLFEGENKNTE